MLSPSLTRISATSPLTVNDKSAELRGTISPPAAMLAIAVEVSVTVAGSVTVVDALEVCVVGRLAINIKKNKNASKTSGTMAKAIFTHLLDCLGRVA